jgi:hypothetical protein
MSIMKLKTVGCLLILSAIIPSYVGADEDLKIHYNNSSFSTKMDARHELKSIHQQVNQYCTALGERHPEVAEQHDECISTMMHRTARQIDSPNFRNVYREWKFGNG